jgi:hypothetical protein
MKMTEKRIGKIQDELTKFLLNNQETINIADLNNIDLNKLVKSVVDDVTDSFKSYLQTYWLSKEYLDVSYLKIYITPKTYVLVNLDEVWEFTKILVSENNEELKIK